MQSISIIGVGRIGGALAIALSRAGFQVDHLFHRDASTAEKVLELMPARPELASWPDGINEFHSDIVLITTPDPDISRVAHQLHDRLKKRTIVLHTSGSLSSAVLDELPSDGHQTGSMHPLVSVSDAISGAETFSGAFFCIEGSEEAVAAASAIVGSIGGRPFSIDSQQKPLYHAAAVTACGHLVALIDIAIRMLSKCGIEPPAAKEILMPLITSTVANLQTQTTTEALTGSFARVDKEAVGRHLDAIDNLMSERVRDIYMLLGEQSLDLAASGGADPADLQRLREFISIAKRKSG